MSDINAPEITASFFSRLIQNDSARRGVAAAAAGVLIAAISELVWPSSS